MNRILLCCSFIILMASCINEQESLQVIHDRELQTITDYLQNTPLPSVRTERDGATGIAIIWQEENVNGRRPAIGDSLRVNYTGSFFDGRIFDTSIDSVARANNIHNASRKYEPLKISLGRTSLIQGFNFGVFNMKEGDKAIVLIPSAYAYGTAGSSSIPPNTPLRFDLELVEIMTEEEIEI
jgi:hypothetical protein